MGPYLAAIRMCLGAAFLTAVLAASSSGVWLDVPFVRQEKNGCGSATVSMLMNYWSNRGFSITRGSANSQHIHSLLYAEGNRGIWGSDIEKYLEGQGFRTFVFEGQWEDLRHHISQGRPLLVSLGRAGAGSDRHYVVVSGIDEERRLVLVNDPQRRKLTKLHRLSFEKNWQAANRWTLLAVPRQPQ